MGLEKGKSNKSFSDILCMRIAYTNTGSTNQGPLGLNEAWMRRDNWICSKEYVNVHNWIKEVHIVHYFGANQPFFYGSTFSSWSWRFKQEVVQAVKPCKVCLSIDPSPIKWEPGHLNFEETWKRLAIIDVSHYGSGKYLTGIDCGLSRFWIWRRVNVAEELISKV